MTTFTTTACTANTPQGHADKIANNVHERADALTAAIRAEKIDTCGLQEYGPLLHKWFANRQGIGAWLAPWNSRGNGGRTTGNGLLWTKATTQVLHVRPLRFWWRPARNLPSTVARRLSFVEALCANLASESLFVHIDGHIPTARDATDRTRTRIVRGLVRESKRLNRLGLPVVVTMDCNGADLDPLLAAGFRVAARRGVDVVLVLGPIFHIARPVYIPAGGWSDHGFAVAVAVTFLCTPAANVEARVRLPRRSRWFRR